MKSTLITLLGALGCAATAVAAPGDIDATFGTGGGYSVVSSGTDVGLEDITIDASGRLLLAGLRVDSAAAVTPFVVRTSANGVPDAAFGSGGTASPGVVAGAITTGVAVAVSTDRVYLASAGPDRVHVFAYTHAGAPVTTFGSGGHAELVLGADLYPVIDMALQGNRVLVAAGARNPSTSNRDFVIGRLTVSGTPDTAFDGDGRLYARVFTGPAVQNRFTRIALQADGKIVAAGRAAATAGAADAVLARFSSSGVPDATFGSGGIATYDVGANDLGRALAIQADGRIVLAGGRCDPTGVPCRWFALRTLATGALDASYGSGGVRIGSIDYGSFVGEVTLDAAGRAVLVGNATQADDGAVATLLRLTTSGTLDTTFGTGGIVRHAYFPGPAVEYDTHMSVTRDAQGRLVVAGDASTAGPTAPTSRGIVARYQN